MRLTLVAEDRRAKKRIHKEVTKEVTDYGNGGNTKYHIKQLINSTTSMESRKRMTLI